MLQPNILPLQDSSPGPDVGVGEEAKKEASCNAWQEGGGQHNVATRRQGASQRHTARVHVDRAGCLLHHTLHPAAAVHLHLGRNNAAGNTTEIS